MLGIVTPRSAHITIFTNAICLTATWKKQPKEQKQNINNSILNAIMVNLALTLDAKSMKTSFIGSNVGRLSIIKETTTPLTIFKQTFIFLNLRKQNRSKSWNGSWLKAYNNQNDIESIIRFNFHSFLNERKSRQGVFTPPDVARESVCV